MYPYVNRSAMSLKERAFLKYHYVDRANGHVRSKEEIMELLYYTSESSFYKMKAKVAAIIKKAYLTHCKAV